MKTYSGKITGLKRKTKDNSLHIEVKRVTQKEKKFIIRL